MHTTTQLFKQVTVITSARLHMGFYDLSHGAHQFGGLGLTLDAPNTQVKVSTSEKLLIDAKSSKNTAKIIDKLVKSFNLPDNFSVNVLQNIPQHAGLGSGTQMALAIGAGLNQLFNLKLSIAQIAAAAGRGRRSGIGIGAFELGGLLVDNGKQGNAQTSIASRMSFPSDWRVLLISDSAHVGVHGALESSAFGQLNPAQDNVKNLVFKYMLPALQRDDLLAFGAYMIDLQAYNGEYFAPIQGGVYASQDVAKVLAWLQANGAACVGQSSWGPTGFAILRSQLASDLKNQAQLAFAAKPNIGFNIVRGKNSGAEIILA